MESIWNLLPPPVVYITQSLNTNLQLFRGLVHQKKYEEAKAIVDFSNYVFEYIAFSAQMGSREMIDFFFTKGVSFDIEDHNGKNILYILGQRSIFSNATSVYTEMSKYIHGKGYDLQKTDTWFHPLLSIIDQNINVELFTYYINAGSPLDITDRNGLTILMKLIKIGNINHIKYFCGKFKNKYGESKLVEYINERNVFGISSLELSALTDNFDITRFLIANGAQLPFNRILETKYGYKKIVFITPMYSALVNIPMNFKQFCIKLYNKACIDWNNIRLPEIRQIYNLGYPKDIILKSAVMVCEKNMSHDKDSILMFCQKITANVSAIKVQKLYRKFRNKRKNIDSALKIQRAWRRKKYKTILKNKCTICLTTLNLAFSCKLPCNHIFHAHCIGQWRKIENKCPMCRSPINRYPVYL
jgi:Ring finger domain